VLPRCCVLLGCLPWQVVDNEYEGDEDDGEVEAEPGGGGGQLIRGVAARSHLSTAHAHRHDDPESGVPGSHRRERVQ
jgi:hypothetical protein